MKDPAPILRQFEVSQDEVIFWVRPPKWVSAVELVLLVMSTAVGAWLAAGGNDGAGVAAVLLGVALAFRGSLWLIQRRAKFELRLDLRGGAVTLVDVRGLDPERRAENSVSDVATIALTERGLALTWVGDFEPALYGQFQVDEGRWSELVASLRASPPFAARLR